MTNLDFVANISGIFSLFTFAIAISPSLIKLVSNLARHKRVILQTSRYALLTTVCLGLIHGLLTTQKDNIDFYNLNTYLVYAVGLFAFNILVFFAFVYPELKSDQKKLNYLSYAALILLAVHVGQQIAF